MTCQNAFFEWFQRLPVWGQVTVITATGVVGADTLTLVFYAIFFTERVMLDLLFSTLITIVVGAPIAWVVFRQGAEMTRMAEELKVLANRDPLTGLANRRWFMKQVEAKLEEQIQVQAGAVLFIDVDRFKSINDNFGHGVGDRVLEALANLLREPSRVGMIAGRIGGEEFAVYCRAEDRRAVIAYAEQLRCAVGSLAQTENLPVDVTVSIGVAFEGPGRSLETLISSADKSLYVAKKNGRNQVIWEPAEAKAA